MTAHDSASASTTKYRAAPHLQHLSVEGKKEVEGFGQFGGRKTNETTNNVLTAPKQAGLLVASERYFDSAAASTARSRNE